MKVDLMAKAGLPRRSLLQLLREVDADELFVVPDESGLHGEGGVTPDHLAAPGAVGGL